MTEGGTIEDRWIPLVLIALVVSAIVAVVTFESVLRMFRRGPKLVGGELVDGLRTSQSGRHIQVVGVQIYNERESGGEPKTARAVVPEVEAFDLANTSIKRTRGVWFANPGGVPVDTVDFRPTRVEQHAVELVGKFPEDANAYLAGEPGSPSLTPGDYRIRVTLRGDNVKRPARLDFFVRNPGAGKRLTVAKKATDLVDGEAHPAAPVAAAQAVTGAAPDPAPAPAPAPAIRGSISRVQAGPTQPAGAKLDTRFAKRGRGSYTFTVINVGSVDIERIEWILPPEAVNWQIFQEGMVTYPIPILEPDDEQATTAVVAMGGPPAIEITLRGWVGDVEYTRKRTLSVVS